MSNIRSTLIAILNDHSFDRLEPFKQTEVWKSFSYDDRVLLARLLVMQGASQLNQGNQQVLESFEIAKQISSNSPEILYQQSCVLNAQKDNIRCLTLARETLEIALQQDATFFKGRYLLGQVLTNIALFEGESHLFHEADSHYQTAESLLNKDPDFTRLDEFYWKWGYCLDSLGNISEEPVDFLKAVEKYRIAYNYNCPEAEFYNDFGQSLAHLGVLLVNIDYHVEALKMFDRASCIDKGNFNGWFFQALSILTLSDDKNYEHLLDKADICLSKAADIDHNVSELWYRWGQLDAMIGKKGRDLSRMQLSLAKFYKALQLEPGTYGIIVSCAEIEIFLGVHEEKIEMLQSAHLKLLKCVDALSHEPNVWYMLGSCLCEMGTYFNDEEYYHQAIAKFQQGLSMSGYHPLLWYGMALAQYSLGDLKQQQDHLEKALEYFSRVLEFEKGAPPQFYNEWGVALLKLGDMTLQANYVEMAIEKFEKALNQPSVDEKTLNLEWIYNFGCAYDLLGDLKEDSRYFERSVQILSHVLHIDPNYHFARYNLALTYSHLGEAILDVESYQKSIEHFQHLLERDPEDDLIHLDFGMTLTNFGLLIYDVHHPDNAQTVYHQAENHLMQSALLGNTQAYYQLAGLYSINGQFEQAMHFLERSQFCGNLPELEELMHDEWLEALRQTLPFRQFIKQLSS